MNLKLRLAAALLAAAGAASAENDPAAYLFSPVVEQGEREIDSKAGIARGRDGRSFWGGKLGIEYGVTDWWSAEATVNFGREVGESFNILSLEWENRFQFTETGAQPYELGFLFEVEKERESAEGWELRYGPLLQWQHGGLQANLNLLFERRLGADGPREKTGLGYQWQLRWHGGAALDFGAQGFGALGPWDGWARRAEQSHILGPALFAQLGDDDDDGEAEAALLFGTGGAAPTLTLRVQAMIPF